MVAPLEPVLVVERVFDAPRALVWHVWTDPDQAVKWMGPPTCPAKKIEGDFRPGGKWRTIMDGTQQRQDLCHGGEYREIVEPERIVYTFAWENHPTMPRNEMLIELTFEEVGPKKTKLTLRQTQFVNVEQRDGHNVGWSGTFDRLEEYLARQNK
jgi:uncharacterized protein YndB with AHSA1/START domain